MKNFWLNRYRSCFTTSKRCYKRNCTFVWLILLYFMPRIQRASDNHGNGDDPFNGDMNAQIGKPHITNTQRMNGRWGNLILPIKFPAAKTYFQYKSEKVETPFEKWNHGNITDNGEYNRSIQLVAAWKCIKKIWHWTLL